MTSDTISPDITSTSAIPAIYAKDSTVNVAGRDQMSIMNIYKVDPSVGPINLSISTEIYQWLSAVITPTNYQGSPGRHRFVVYRWSAFLMVQRLTILFGFAAHVCIFVIYESLGSKLVWLLVKARLS